MNEILEAKYNLKVHDIDNITHRYMPVSINLKTKLSVDNYLQHYTDWYYTCPDKARNVNMYADRFANIRQASIGYKKRIDYITAKCVV